MNGVNVFFFHRDFLGRPMTSTMNFAQKYNLGDPIYGCFYQAEYDSYTDELQALMG